MMGHGGLWLIKKDALDQGKIAASHKSAVTRAPWIVPLILANAAAVLSGFDHEIVVESVHSPLAYGLAGRADEIVYAVDVTALEKVLTGAIEMRREAYKFPVNRGKTETIRAPDSIFYESDIAKWWIENCAKPDPVEPILKVFWHEGEITVLRRRSEESIQEELAKLETERDRLLRVAKAAEERNETLCYISDEAVEGVARKPAIVDTAPKSEAADTLGIKDVGVLEVYELFWEADGTMRMRSCGDVPQVFAKELFSSVEGCFRAIQDPEIEAMFYRTPECIYLVDWERLERAVWERGGRLCFDGSWEVHDKRWEEAWRGALHDARDLHRHRNSDRMFAKDVIVVRRKARAWELEESS